MVLCRGLRRLRRFTASARPQLQLLKRLPPKEQRARLLALLRADLGSLDEEIQDETWQMPSLSATNRTAEGPGFDFRTRVCDIERQGSETGSHKIMGFWGGLLGDGFWIFLGRWNYHDLI